ncbi:MAG TPA: HEAT repeat domain-containing protein [Myxococcales bacterium]|jgi:HEAT repeat protein
MDEAVAAGPERLKDPDPEVRYRAVTLLDAERDLERVLESLSDESWRVRKAAVERLVGLADPERAIEGLLLRLRDADDAGARNSAAEALARLGPPAVGPVTARLKDPDCDVRKFAADVLGELADPSSVPALVEALRDADGNIRTAAAEALGKVGGDPAAAALEDAIARGDRMLQLAALDALGHLGKAPPIAVLAPLAKDKYLRRAVLRLLGVVAGRGSVELIAEGLRDPSKSTREAAFEALALQAQRFGERGVQGFAQAVKATAKSTAKLATLAREMLLAGNALAIEGAMRVLGVTGEPADAAAVVRAASDESLKEAALDALRGMGAPAGPALLRALPDLLPEVRPLAIRALSQLREHSATPALVELAREGGEAERALAVEALGALGDPAAIQSLARLLEDPALCGEAARALVSLAKADRDAVREACKGKLGGPASASAVRVLGRIGTPEDLPLLKTALRSEHTEVRLAAAEAAQTLGETGAEELLRLALADEAPPVRAAAARGLGAFPSEETFAALGEALDDREASVSAAAADALGELGETRAIEALTRAVSRGESQPGTPEVLPAIAAVRALSRLSAATPALLARAVAHPDPEVVKEAVAAAEALPDAGEVLLAAARSARWDVRRAAARALAARGDRSLLAPVREIARAERDPLAAEAFAEAVRVLEARPSRD